MTHPDLVMLSDVDTAGGSSNQTRVYTTSAQLKLELNAVDLGGRLALSALPEGAPEIEYAERGRSGGVRIDPDMPFRQSDAVHYAAAPRQLRIIRGESGSGKRVVAAETARLHAQPGWQVLSVSPTGPGWRLWNGKAPKTPQSQTVHEGDRRVGGR